MSLRVRARVACPLPLLALALAAAAGCLRTNPSGLGYLGGSDPDGTQTGPVPGGPPAPPGVPIVSLAHFLSEGRPAAELEAPASSSCSSSTRCPGGPG